MCHVKDHKDIRWGREVRPSGEWVEKRNKDMEKKLCPLSRVYVVSVQRILTEALNGKKEW